MKRQHITTGTIKFQSKAFFEMVDVVKAYISEQYLTERAAPATSDTISDWISVAEAMRLLSVGRTRLQELKNDGKIRFFQDRKKLKFSRKSIEKYLNEHST